MFFGLEMPFYTPIAPLTDVVLPPNIDVIDDKPPLTNKLAKAPTNPPPRNPAPVAATVEY